VFLERDGMIRFATWLYLWRKEEKERKKENMSNFIKRYSSGGSIYWFNLSRGYFIIGTKS